MTTGEQLLQTVARSLKTEEGQPAQDAEHSVREVRFAVAMVGGTSLAVHINGTSQELCRMVRGEGAYGLAKLLTCSHAYVDVLSGTSAGGINSILLATALANKTSMRRSSTLFRDQADLDMLLPVPGSEDNPTSLLRGEGHILPEVRKAVELCRQPAGEAPLWSGLRWTGDQSYTDLDLFITASYLTGQPRNFSDAVGTPIYTSSHQGVFSFRHRSDESDFTGDDSDKKVGRLARAGRTTSSLPAVFEPSRVDRSEFLEHQFRFHPTAEHHYLGDGGYWNGRPLDLIVRAVAEKTARRKVWRKILLVEPAPDKPVLNKPEELPSGLDHLRRYNAIAGSQSLHTTLEQVARHNREVKRVLEVRQAAVTNRAVPSLAQINLWRDLRRSEVVDNVCDYLREDVFATDQPVLADFPKVLWDALRRPPAELGSAEQLLERIDLYGLERWLLRTMDEAYDSGNYAILNGGLNQLFARFVARRDQVKESLRKHLCSEGSRALGGDPQTFACELLKLAHDECGQFFVELQAELKRYNPSTRMDDVWLYPLERASSFANLQTLDIVMVDPKINLGFSNRPEELKVAGKELFKFGGFLSRCWRSNDLLWGRLDGSSTLLKVLLEDEERLKQVLTSVDLSSQVADYLRGGATPDSIGSWLVDKYKDLKALASPTRTTELRQVLIERHHLDILSEEIPELLAADLVESAEWRRADRPRWMATQAGERFCMMHEAATGMLRSRVSGVLRALAGQTVAQELRADPAYPSTLVSLHELNRPESVTAIPLLVSLRRSCQMGLAALSVLKDSTGEALEPISPLLKLLRAGLRAGYVVSNSILQNDLARAIAVTVVIVLVAASLTFGALFKLPALWATGLLGVAAAYAAYASSGFVQLAMALGVVAWWAVLAQHGQRDGLQVLQSVLPLSSFLVMSSVLYCAFVDWRRLNLKKWEQGVLVSLTAALVGLGAVVQLRFNPDRNQVALSLVVWAICLLAWSFNDSNRFGFRAWWSSLSATFSRIAHFAVLLFAILTGLRTAGARVSEGALAAQLAWKGPAAPELQAQLLWDDLFAVGYSFALFLGLYWLHLRTRWSVLRLWAGLSLLAGICDLLENTLIRLDLYHLTLFNLSVNPDNQALLIAMLAYAKFTLILPCLAVGGLSLLYSILAFPKRHAMGAQEFLEMLDARCPSGFRIAASPSFSIGTREFQASRLLLSKQGQGRPPEGSCFLFVNIPPPELLLTVAGPAYCVLSMSIPPDSGLDPSYLKRLPPIIQFNRGKPSSLVWLQGKEKGDWMLICDGREYVWDNEWVRYYRAGNTWKRQRLDGSNEDVGAGELRLSFARGDWSRRANPPAERTTRA